MSSSWIQRLPWIGLNGMPVCLNIILNHPQSNQKEAWKCCSRQRSLFTPSGCVLYARTTLYFVWRSLGIHRIQKPSPMDLPIQHVTVTFVGLEVIKHPSCHDHETNPRYLCQTVRLFEVWAIITCQLVRYTSKRHNFGPLLGVPSPEPLVP